MLTIDEALDAVLEQARPVRRRGRSLERATGCVLGEDVAADLDLPPFDKSIVDGYAVRVRDLAAGDRLRVGEVITAGQVPSRPLGPREAAVIMTGAPVPAGADAVVMHEHTRAADGDVWIEEPRVRAGQNILTRGREMCAGEIVLTAGSILNAARLGLLASVGRTTVEVIQPHVAVVPTGDELVPPDQVPGPGPDSKFQRRHAPGAGRSSKERTPERCRSRATSRTRCYRSLEQGLDADLLIVTGGVSAGQKDLVPASPRGSRRTADLSQGPSQAGQAGLVRRGAGPRWASGGTGLWTSRKPCQQPGGVSALGQAGLDRDGGQAGTTAQTARSTPAARLHSPWRPPDVLSRRGWSKSTEGRDVEPLAWSGSADLRTAAEADGFAVFGAGDREYAAGEVVEFLPMR